MAIFHWFLALCYLTDLMFKTFSLQSKNCETLFVVHNSTWSYIITLKEGQSFSKKKGFNIHQPKAPLTEAAEAEGSATMRADDVGTAFSIVCKQGLAPWTGPEVWTSSCRAVWVSDFCVAEECSTERTVRQCAGIGGQSVAWPLSLTRQAEPKHRPLQFRARLADHTLTIQNYHISLMTTRTLGRRKELVRFGHKIK